MTTKSNPVRRVDLQPLGLPSLIPSQTGDCANMTYHAATLCQAAVWPLHLGYLVEHGILLQQRADASFHTPIT